jgi:chromosome segregation ATPase
MDPILIVLCTTAGAVVGTSVGILLLHRKLRPPITETELAGLRIRLETNEASLAEANANVMDLRKQIVAHEQTTQQDREALKEKQQLLDLASADVQREAAHASAAERLAEQLTAQVATLTEERGKLEARLKVESKVLDEKKTQVASLGPQLEAEKKQVHELTGQVNRLTAESAELKSSVEQENGRRVFLEAQLAADQDRLKMLTSQLADMQTERLRFEARLQEERQAARKGMELLLMAQEKLSHMFDPAGESSQKGKGDGHGSHEVIAIMSSQEPVETATAVSEAKSEVLTEAVVVNIKVRQAS